MTSWLLALLAYGAGQLIAGLIVLYVLDGRAADRAVARVDAAFDQMLADVAEARGRTAT